MRVRRSFLFMPGSNPRAMEKGRDLPADGVILDLEDAVGEEHKTDARARISKAIIDKVYSHREVMVRTNAIGSAWWPDDCAMASSALPDTILVPKVSSAYDIQTIEKLLSDLEAPLSLKVWVMIETPLALLNLREIAALAAPSTRLSGFVIGPYDIARAAKIPLDSVRRTLMPLLLDCVIAARAHHLGILDGPYSDFRDDNGFLNECREAKALGFDGKALIHPSQIDISNQVFAPSPADIEQAREVVLAFERPENHDKGVIQISGRMVERLHLDMAHRVLAIADSVDAGGR